MTPKGQTHAPQMRLARERIKEELQKKYPSAKELRKRLVEIQGNDGKISYTTCYKLAKEIFENWYFDDIRDFYLECGYMSMYELSHTRAVNDHYKRVANVILLNIHN